MIASKTKPLTSKQKRVYDFICAYLEKNKLSPTIAEIAQFLGVSSLRTVTQYLESLEKKNLITRLRGQSRCIKLACILEGMSATVTLPVVSAAGCDNLGVFAEQTFDEFVTLDKDFLQGKRPEKMVVLRAIGESMADAGIATGDLVLAEVTNEVASKDKVVAIVDGMAVIKQINFSPNAVILAPMSPDPEYHPIVMRRDFQVFGKVINVIKNSLGGEELTYESL